ncbi:MAG: HTTM domain-containing protein [Acidimicrobiales bacterium]
MSGTTTPLDTWNRFWFQPQPTSTLAVVRIAYGLVVVAWALSMAPDLATFFSTSGVVAHPGDHGGGLEATVVGDATIRGLHLVLVIGSVCLMLGYRTRLASVVVFVCIVWFQRRNPFILNAGDRLLANLGFYLMLAPAGASLSVDRWRRAPTAFCEFPARAPWALRLVQIQLSVLYVSTVWEKLQGQTWADGTAVSYALRIGQLSRLTLPDGLTESVPLMHVLTWSTLVIELGLAFLVWSRRLRPWVLCCGLALHLCIELTMMVGFLGAAVMITYVAFVPADAMTAALLRFQLCRRRTQIPCLRRLRPWEYCLRGRRFLARVSRRVTVMADLEVDPAEPVPTGRDDGGSRCSAACAAGADAPRAVCAARSGSDRVDDSSSAVRPVTATRSATSKVAPRMAAARSVSSESSGSPVIRRRMVSRSGGGSPMSVTSATPLSRVMAPSSSRAATISEMKRGFPAAPATRWRSLGPGRSPRWWRTRAPTSSG